MHGRSKYTESRLWAVWFTVVSFVLVLWGAVFAVFGLGVLPLVNSKVLLTWESALYGSVLVGWGSTLVLSGRIAFRRNDRELMKVLLLGLIVWLLMEGSFSLYLGVFINSGVDVAVMLLFGLPLARGISRPIPDDSGPRDNKPLEHDSK